MEGPWMPRHLKQLLQAISSPLLEILGSMKKQEVVAEEEFSLVQGAGSPTQKVKALIDLLAGKGSQGFQAGQDLTENSAAPLSLHSTAYDSGMQKHLEVLLSRYGVSVDLDLLSEKAASERLTNLLLVEGLTDLQLKEHDFTQIEATRGQRRVAKTIPLERLFLPLSKVSIPPRISVTVGVAGIGKTTLVAQYVSKWARREISKDISLVLPLNFRELNIYEKLSAERLVRSVFPHISETGLTWLGSGQVLMILDGLDEFKVALDFSNTVACTDPKKEVPVDNLITNIIRGNLFPEVSIWVTARPTAASQIPGGLVDRMTEIRGFNEVEIQAYLSQMFPDSHDLPGQVLSQVQANKALYLMCTVPSFCRLCGTVLGYLVRNGLGCQSSELAPPRTLSEIYSWYFKIALCGEGQDRWRESPRIEQAVHSGRKMMGTLGRLAFHGLLRKKYVFYEQDMKAFGVDLPLLQSSLCSCFLLREETPTSSAYCFIHLTLQEFAAAAYYYNAAKRAIFDLFTESGMSWPKLGFLTHFKNAVQRASQEDNGQLDVFLRFLSGFLSPQVNSVLASWFLGRDEHNSYRVQALAHLQGYLRADTPISSRTVNVLRCLHELQYTELARAVEEGLESENLAGLLDPMHRSALAYLLQVSEICAQETNLTRCLNYAILKSLLPQLLYCRNLRLDNNQFQDNVMELLGSVLSSKDCYIQKISLAENQIHNKGTKSLARSLLVNRSLTVLDLRSNSIGPQGAKALADSLKINRVLVSLSLQNNAIKDDGAKFVADALMVNHKLSVLQLQKNTIGPLGAKSIADALKKNGSLKELIFSSNSVGNDGSKALAEALKVNQSLITLDLQSNSISDAGVTALTHALRSNQTLLSLNLRENSISPEGARDIASALCSNRVLQNLDLTANLLQDEGAQAIALAVKENRALKSLHLQWNFIQANAAKALGQALQSNRSLTILDLQENAIGDEGMMALSRALKINTSLTALYLQVASIGVLGAQALGDALAVNRTLEILDLRGNSIGADGAKAMANALKINPSLQMLNLQENSLGMDGAICIATALSGNHGLQHVNLQGNHIGESGARMISEAIKTNAPNCIVEM
ncbi:NLR family CARD domain-containing protein 3 isoform X1 [Monodelphis domestica]|uniref:NLR family CARD domain-containing protein 3 isoform X1 n=1 Tax=Monodelphis domestica TaxID=13616 RepID=UPI0004433759|nr:NLR family CARD domain-containing protein 3 isoform X1 [Monodelphis domestica]